MKQHTTNYINTFIEVAEDCPALIAEVPKQKGEQKTVALLQYELITKHPYKYTSDDVLFQVYVTKNDILNRNGRKRGKYFSQKVRLV